MSLKQQPLIQHSKSLLKSKRLSKAVCGTVVVAAALAAAGGARRDRKAILMLTRKEKC